MPQLKSNNLCIEYDTFGESSETPLLLIMGLGAQMTRWSDEFCGLLASAGHWVIRFDNRDVGLSEHLESAGAPNIGAIAEAIAQGQTPEVAYGLEDMADDAVGVLDGLGVDSAHICGASLGGMIAQTMAIQHPTRVKTLTSIMSSTGNRSLPPAKPQAVAVLMAPPAKSRDEILDRAVQNSKVIGSPGYPADPAEVRERAGIDFDRAFYPVGTARQMAAASIQQDRRAALSKLEIPALVIHGKEDVLVPIKGGVDTHESLSNSTFWAVDGMGHDLPKALWPDIVSRVTTLTRQV